MILTACSQVNKLVQGPGSTFAISSPNPISTPTQQSADSTLNLPAHTPQASPQPTVAVTPDKLAADANLAAVKPDHIVIVVEENHSYEKIIGHPSAPYMNALAEQGAFFTQSYAVTHPSQPNYLLLFSGANQGVKDDSCGHVFKTANMASELLHAGYTFGGFSEDLPSVGSFACTHSQYGRKHSPWVNFTNVPKETNMPLDQFPSDYNNLPTVSYVIPNMDHDMHDGTIKTADDWLKNHLGPYIEWAKTHNSLFILTWDEDDSSKDNHIPTIFIGQMVKKGHYDQHITHLNVLRTLEDLYNLPPVGNSADAGPIQHIWQQ
ncbi:alkaline phosphatase family protein [Paenibacillus sp. N3.4]|uniref:alkaline phosphatase family protein n=1 Tax=Paenibacillus sp. N3.4 TaxID=2603222 RepID=UPI0021C3CEDE|nr:alkaline phosphatase family protein [Paenibacillus sp. N3.4]